MADDQESGGWMEQLIRKRKQQIDEAAGDAGAEGEPKQPAQGSQQVPEDPQVIKQRKTNLFDSALRGAYRLIGGK